MQIEITHVDTSNLDPNPWNPNVMNDTVKRAARESIQRFGMIDPLVVRAKGKRFEIIDGEHRWRACADLGIDTIPVVVIKAGDAEAKKLTVILNDIKGRHDHDLLGSILTDLRLELDSDEFALALPYDDDELSALLDRGELVMPTDADEAPEPPDVADSIVGEVYRLGPHKLFCGDATDSASYAALGEQAHMLFTDPPYGVDYIGKTKDALKIKNDALGDDGTRALVADALTAALPRIVDGGSFYICTPPGPLVAEFIAACADAGVDPRQVIVWVKDQFVLGRSDYHARHEHIVYGWKGGLAHYFVGDRTQDTVWEIDRPKRSDVHPTMKPVELVARAIRNSSLNGGVILDPFAGSGTTMIAAEATGRRSLMIELDPRYCDVIRRRWEEHTAR